MCILKCFEEVSGLRVNYNKSKLYGFGVNEVDLRDMARWMRCRVGEFPFTYLGLPIGENMRRVGAWNTVMVKVKNHLADWKSKSMSFEGRLTSIKSVIGRLPFNVVKEQSEIIEVPITELVEFISARQSFSLEIIHKRVSEIEQIRSEEVESQLVVSYSNQDQELEAAQYDLAPAAMGRLPKEFCLRWEASLEMLEDFFSFDLESLEDSASLLNFLLFFPRSDPAEGSQSLSLSSALSYALVLLHLWSISFSYGLKLEMMRRLISRHRLEEGLVKDCSLY
ncbi:hypothetical protein Tco_1262765 [Tanacetum coccineum]